MDFKSPWIWFGTRVGGSNHLSPTILFKKLQPVDGWSERHCKKLRTASTSRLDTSKTVGSLVTWSS
jgi:hypothetical protein